MMAGSSSASGAPRRPPGEKAAGPDIWTSEGLREFTLDAATFTYCTACRHRADAHSLRGTGVALVTCSHCDCRTRHP